MNKLAPPRDRLLRLTAWSFIVLAVLAVGAIAYVGIHGLIVNLDEYRPGFSGGSVA